MARRFGSNGGIGAWEVMRLVQGAFLLVVEFGLEFVASDDKAMHRLSVHVQDCLRSLFRMPFKLANNILLCETGIPPTFIRAGYIKARCAQWFLNHSYCSSFPWHGSISFKWVIPRMKAVRMASDETLTHVLSFHIAPN